MSSVETRSKTTKRHEYVTSAPAMWADIKEAMAFAARDREAKGLENRWDDVIQVEGNEEEIVVFWVEDIV
jgi:hypothetical protein